MRSPLSAASCPSTVYVWRVERLLQARRPRTTRRPSSRASSASTASLPPQTPSTQREPRRSCAAGREAISVDETAPPTAFTSSSSPLGRHHEPAARRGRRSARGRARNGTCGVPNRTKCTSTASPTERSTARGPRAGSRAEQCGETAPGPTGDGDVVAVRRLVPRTVLVLVPVLGMRDLEDLRGPGALSFFKTSSENTGASRRASSDGDPHGAREERPARPRREVFPSERSKKGLERGERIGRRRDGPSDLVRRWSLSAEPTR